LQILNFRGSIGSLFSGRVSNKEKNVYDIDTPGPRAEEGSQLPEAGHGRVPEELEGASDVGCHTVHVQEAAGNCSGVEIMKPFVSFTLRKILGNSLQSSIIFAG
jgi:hypothetical protein